MTDKRFRFGFIVSAVWSCAITALLVFKRVDATKMTPNEWGDFFSGVFAPLAFLWLVLGYLQQGEELGLSTEALRLQADELKNSVEQQRELVEVSRQQVEGEREALAYERNLREEGAKPNLLVAPAGGTFRGDGVSKYNLVLTNIGATATNILAELITEDGKTFRLLDMPFFGNGAQQRTTFEVASPISGSESRLHISYKDALGKHVTTTFAVGRNTDHPHSELKFTKIEV